jgi:hypothetical protein
MTAESPLEQPSVPDLRAALRKARMESAERSGVLVELRTAELGRLDLLRQELEPVFAQVPKEIDLFDAAILPGDPARLFVDVIGFVEMGHDKRTYRFFQDTRYGRKTIAESQDLEVMVQAVTDYVARRIIEREKALAANTLLEDEATGETPAPAPLPAMNAASAAPAAASKPASASRWRKKAKDALVEENRHGSLALLFVVALLAAFIAFYGAGFLWNAGFRSLGVS